MRWYHSKKKKPTIGAFYPQVRNICLNQTLQEFHKGGSLIAVYAQYSAHTARYYLSIPTPSVVFSIWGTLFSVPCCLGLIITSYTHLRHSESETGTGHGEKMGNMEKLARHEPS